MKHKIKNIIYTYIGRQSFITWVSLGGVDVSNVP